MKVKGIFILIYVLPISLFSCKKKSQLFQLVLPAESGIHFSNKIAEKDSINPIDLTNIYNGGGIGIGDFNNDGLTDVYFTGNQVASQLYINKGDFKFENVTEAANVSGNGKWCRGASVVDINNDGFEDLYVSASILSDPIKRENLLYVNQGPDKAGTPHFKEMAGEYGLNDTTHTTMAAFFDYDNDGDLDVYLTVNQIIKTNNPSVFHPKIKDGSYPSTGRLYRNDWDSLLKHPVFTNVSKQAGITIEGLGHGVNIADINKDGWKDIFVTNDFNSNDLLYINNHDGTFTDKASCYFKHTSANGMGQDVIDINNDGLSDVIELDMNPEDNYRKKMMLNANSYQTYQNSDYYGYQYQYVRNTLQLNQGPRVNESDSVGDPVFSDIGFFAGISETDWSWCPLVADFDNDGFRDIIITNGYPKDITDHDFITFRREASLIATKEMVLSQIPEVKLHNYAFHNKGDLTFSNTTNEWGLATPSFSNGAAYADMDNDGDMDIIVNNINDSAFLYRNTLMDGKERTEHYLAIKLNGPPTNLDGLGTWIEIYYQGKMQAYEQTPYRGYLSTVDMRPHFGLGSVPELDSIIIKWPDGKKQVLNKVHADQVLSVSIKDADRTYKWATPARVTDNLLRDITDEINLQYTDKSRDFVDFNIQKLLPHKFTEYGPSLAAGDIDGDGLDDMISGGAPSQSPVLFFQKKDGSFFQRNLLPDSLIIEKSSHDEGLTLFDADGDGDLDLYMASGGYEAKANTNAYEDHFYINDGKGNFTVTTTALPPNFTSKSCVRVFDYDKDGDLDLFIAGRVEPAAYPKPVSCFIYRNDSKDGVIKFSDVTSSVAPALNNIGLVCDAIWTDFDNDGWQDLILAGEWMPLTFFKNEEGRFINITAATGADNKKGWWTSILPGDFDNDGDVDYVVGNLGLNSLFKASDKYPVGIYAKDFDNNSSFDAIPFLYLPASQSDTVKREYPVHSRDDMVKQIISFRSKFQNYKSYANATIDKMFTEKEMEGVLTLQANYFSNSFLRNNGNGKFELMPLPMGTQFSCMNGMLAEDFDGDGNLDILAAGNDYGTDVGIGRYDACNGIFLKGDGQGNFKTLSILQSGWFVPGNAKAVVKLRGGNGRCLVAVSQNKDKMKIFEMKKTIMPVQLQPGDISAMIKYRNGRIQKREVNYGASFLSQSGRFLNSDSAISSIIIKGSDGKERQIAQ